MDKPILLPIHEHPLTPSARFITDRCYFCLKEGHIYSGYHCTECYQWFHKECAEAPFEIIHPSHPHHTLTSMTFTEGCKCSLCAVIGWQRGYFCSLCDFEVDMKCAYKSPPLAIELPESHLSKEGKKVLVANCEVCQDDSENYPILFHVGCANLSQEVNHFSHLIHPLMLVSSESLSDVLDKSCLLCGRASNKALYHCSTCNFTLCPFCGKNPPPLTIEHYKTHNHRLTLWPRKISFTCNVCGLQGDRSPYICYSCNIMIHRKCFGLPHVININRHDHRVSLTNRVGLANSKCGVCRTSVNPYYGGYSCTVCPNYVVHPQCAMKKGVSDLIELEGTPEDPIIPPYIVVGDGLIQHFSHDQEHYLRLNKDDVARDESSRCEACVLPVYSDPIYSCEKCIFMLHETCANLPMKKRLLFSYESYTLNARGDAFDCRSCGIVSNGYSYEAENGLRNLDVSCGSFSEPFLFDGHSHPLYYKEDGSFDTCIACKRKGVTMLDCDDCDYQVHLGCANLPKRVKHRSDDHHRTLCYGEGEEEDEDAFGKYWCDICERETDSRKWFYTCSHCGVTLHIQCVLGDFYRLMPNRYVSFVDLRSRNQEAEVVPNDKSDRPFCGKCKLRCIAPFILKFSDSDKRYICSERCLLPF